MLTTDLWNRPAGRWKSRALTLVILAAPLWLFADMYQTYRLHSDDFAYIGASRTWSRTLDNLFVPHNTHIVPAWRVLTWGVIQGAGRLANLPTTLAAVAYLALVLTMLAIGRLVARESGSRAIGLAAMLALGLTSVMRRPATWYSAGQTCWAGLGVLVMLLLLQGWRRSGGTWRLVLAVLAVWIAGGMWTIGHAAGPVGAVYLWADGRRRCRLAAVVPLAATLVAVLVAIGLGGREIDAEISFHGRTSEEAANPDMGISHTLQAIPESLILGNLALAAETTPSQGAMLSLILAIVWAATRRPSPGSGKLDAENAWRVSAPPPRVLAVTATLAVLLGTVATLIGGLVPEAAQALRWAVFGALGGVVVSGRGSPLERAGMALVLIAYSVEWTFRGYLPFTSLRGIVPWYETIPLIGAVLFAAGWWGGGPADRLPVREPRGLTVRAVVVLMVALVAMLAAHRPRVNVLFTTDVPAMSDAERRAFATPELRYLRARYLATEFALRQRRHLARMDRAEVVARNLGVGLDGIERTFGRIECPEIPDVYDAAPMLALPARGRTDDPAVIRPALAGLLEMEPEPTLPAALRAPGP